MDQLPNMIYLASIWVIPVIIAITFHEAAHGYVARLLGDDTAWRLGRVSLNPLKHIDPFGTILLPGLRPVSVASFVLLRPSQRISTCRPTRSSPLAIAD